MSADLWDAFVDPPADARPRVWWHWMDGNIDIAGIDLDLAWMARVGLAGAQMFEGGMGHPQVVEQRLTHLSPEWQAAFAHAVRRAAQLDLELTVATSAGWSAAGAPWVAPADAMKKLVWSITRVGEGSETVVLPALPDAAGPYLDVPTPSGPEPRLGATIAVVAFPDRPELAPLRPDDAWSSAGSVDAALLTDGRFADAIRLPRAADARCEAWIVEHFATPVEVGAVTVGLPGRRGFGAPPPADAVLECSDDGVTFTPIVQLVATASPVRSATFTPVRASWFRLRLTGEPASAAFPPVGDGVLLPVMGPSGPATFDVSELSLWAGGRVGSAEEKAGFATLLDYEAARDHAPAEPSAVPAASVVDVTGLVGDDGVLRWEAPPGEWVVLRVGWSLTGKRNGPAPAEATGLEVDKLSAAVVRAYIERHLGELEAASGQALGRGPSGLMSDSIESGPQTWTPGLDAEFSRRRGYPLTAWWPALAGWVVDDVDSTEAMLWDWRRTIAELVADAYYGTIAEAAHRRGMTYYAEALEDHRPQLGDDLEMRRHADVPMGAMWCFDPDDGPRPTFVADLRGASSVAHLYGKRHVGAESMSAFGQPWRYAPWSLKPIADLELALGVTRFCIHTSPHQPSVADGPGVSLAPTLGQTFDRNETWAESAAPWITYLARCSAMLSAGVPVAEIASLYGEEAPVTAVFGDAPVDDVPDGYGFDLVNAHALHHALSISGGRLVSLGGCEYRVLHLGRGCTRLTLATLRRIAQIAAGGVPVVGRRPLGSPSRADDPVEVAGAIDALWGEGGAALDVSLEVALAASGIVRAWASSGPALVNRRRSPTADVCFVANPGSSPITVELVVRDRSDRVESWDPVAVTASTLPVAVRDGRTAVELTLPGHGSRFCVIGASPTETSEGCRALAAPITVERVLEIGWHLVVDPDGAAEALAAPVSGDWSTLARTRYFSGTVAFVGTLEVTDTEAAAARLELALGDVRDVAEVVVGGRSAGIAWAPPFVVDLTGRVHPGANELEVRVTNCWANRLVGVAAAEADPLPPWFVVPVTADAPVRPAGLLGPVTLRRGDGPGGGVSRPSGSEPADATGSRPRDPTPAIGPTAARRSAP